MIITCYCSSSTEVNVNMKIQEHVDQNKNWCTMAGQEVFQCYGCGMIAINPAGRDVDGDVYCSYCVGRQ